MGERKALATHHNPFYYFNTGKSYDVDLRKKELSRYQ